MSKTCEYCDATFSRQSIVIRHYQSCKMKLLTEQKEMYETQLQTLQTQYETQLQNQLHTLQTQYETLQTQYETLQTQYNSETLKLHEQLSEQKQLTKTLQQQIFEIAKQPKVNQITNNTTTQTNNSRNTAIINQLAPYDLTTDQIT